MIRHSFIFNQNVLSLEMDQEEKILSVKKLIEAGTITDLHGIFVHVKKSNVNLAIGGNYYRLLRYVSNPKLMNFNDVYAFARLFQVTPEQIARLVMNQIEGKK